MTTICVFVPIVFVEGVAGQLFGDQAMTVTFSLVVSLLVALTIIPMLASRGARDPVDEAYEGGRVFEVLAWIARGFKAVALGIAKVFGWVIAGPLKLFEMGYVAPGQGVLEGSGLGTAALLDHRGCRFCHAGGKLDALIPSLGRELIPELIQGEFFVNTELPPGTHLDVTQRRMAGLERFSMGLEDITSVYSITGASNEQGGAAG